jgi:hypothetical protein
MTEKVRNSQILNHKWADPVCVEKLIATALTDTSGKWASKDNLKEYTDRVIGMCIVAVVNTPTTHAKTTYDLDLTKATIENSIKNIKLTFGRNV